MIANDLDLYFTKRLIIKPKLRKDCRPLLGWSHQQFDAGELRFRLFHFHRESFGDRDRQHAIARSRFAEEAIVKQLQHAIDMLTVDERFIENQRPTFGFHQAIDAGDLGNQRIRFRVEDRDIGCTELLRSEDLKFGRLDPHPKIRCYPRLPFAAQVGLIVGGSIDDSGHHQAQDRQKPEGYQKEPNAEFLGRLVNDGPGTNPFNHGRGL